MTSELTKIEALARRVQELEAQVAAKSAPPWNSSSEVFDQSEESVAFRQRIDEEVESARAADRAALGLDAPHAGTVERPA